MLQFSRWSLHAYMIKNGEKEGKRNETYRTSTLTFALDDDGTAVARGCSSPSLSSWELPGSLSFSEASTPLTNLETWHAHCFTDCPQKSHLKGQSIKVWPSVKPQTTKLKYYFSCLIQICRPHQSARHPENPTHILNAMWHLFVWYEPLLVFAFQENFELTANSRSFLKLPPLSFR